MHQPLRLALLVASIYSGGVLAQAKPIDISAQSLGSALTTLASQSGIQILFSADELKGAQASALRGQLSPEEALRKLLESSGFTFSSTSKGTYVVQKLSAASGNKVLPEVLVTADAEHSYKANKITVAGKTPLTPREIPNSVSVLTRQQMDDQDLVTMSDGLKQITGVTVFANDTTNDQVIARGYSLGAMYDGIPSYSGLTAIQQYDLALYERVEVLRGPAGLLQGSGEPGGVVNMVRKRAQNAFSANATLSAGSWENYRLEGDVTGPLNEDKSLRGRVVVADQDRQYFYDKTHTKKWLAYGVLEYDLQPSTTVSLSASIQNDNTMAPSSGLPLYTNYAFLNVDRSTNVYPSWVNYQVRTEEINANLEHKFDNRWVGKLAYNHRKQHSYAKDSWPSSGVNPTTLLMTSYQRSEYESDYIRDGFDAYLNGPFELFGQTHNLMLGFNADTRKSTSKSGNASSFSNVLLGNEDSVTEPSINYTSGSESVISQYGPYSQLRIRLFDPLTLVFGGRLTTFSSKSRDVSPSAQTDWVKGNNKANNHFTPYAGLIFDLSKQISLYGSYADIFAPQTQKKADGSIIDPRTGRQYEIGSKGEFFDGKLAASIALFNIRDQNRAYRDPDYPSNTTPYYLAAGEIESKGWETEITGSPLRGLELSAGYTRLLTKYLKDRTLEGKEYSIMSPHHLVKLWANYRFSDDTAKGLSLGAGMQANSGTQSTRSNRSVEGTSGYAIFNARVAYQFDRNYSLSLAINNLFDKTYYASIGTTTAYNFYGEPRNFMLSLRASY